MSQWNFKARCQLAATGIAKEWFLMLVDAQAMTSSDEQKALLAKLNMNAGSNGLLLESTHLRNLDVELIDDDASINIDAGSELSFDFFANLVQQFEELKITNYRARLYDSSTNSLQSWLQPDVEVDWEDKVVCIIGIDEEEGVHDAIKEQGADLVGESADEFDVVVFGEQTPFEVVSNMADFKDVLIIPEDDVWDYLEDAFC